MFQVRTFIAVEVDSFTRDRLGGLTEQLGRAVGRSVKWVDPINWHVTLLFLGNVEQNQGVVDVCRAVERACRDRPPVAFSLAGLSAFPNVRRPRTLVATVGDGAEGLAALHDALEGPLMETGCYRHEDRAYTPHVTLGRVLAEADPAELEKVVRQYARWGGGQSEAREVVVVGSELTPEGPEYAILSRSALRGNSG